ncbi:hypothetical protein KBC70_04325 [Candidatus Woesebacteria bacterium]|nr:hypothetical protein [Candidatus Woesebacteria bacterium]
MSRASSLYPIGDVLVRGENLDESNLYPIGYVPVSGENPDSESTGSWSPVNPTQDSFLKKYFPGVRGALSMIKDEISGIVSRSADEINDFLASRGFSMKLEPFGPDSIGFASVLDLVVEWMTEGTRTLVRSVTSGRDFTAVRLTDGVRFCRSDNHTHPIALIATKSGDLVAMTKLDSVPNGAFALEELAGQLTRDAYQVFNEFGAVVFPMVNLDRDFDVSWLLGMELNGDPITQAIGQVKLRMNAKGARAQAAVAIVVTRSMPPRTFEDMVIDGQFLVWFIRPEFDSEQQYVPLFVAHVTEEDWADPGDLSVANG